MPTPNLGYQSFYQAQLTSAISDTDLTIPVSTGPLPDEGFLVIDATVTSKREIIYYTSKTSNSVTCPADGRGYDGTTAVSHSQNAEVIMAPVGAMFSSLRDLFETTPQGWTNMTEAVSSVTALGNRSYTMVMDSDVSDTLSEGMRLRTTRTVASTQNAFSLDGSNDYYNDTTVAGMTFTDDFSVSAWVYVTAYQIGYIASRYNGTSGWGLTLNADGTIQMRGWNASSGNYSEVKSYQSVPLNRWVHIAAQLDMSAFTATTTTSYVMIDGVNVPSVVARAGTNPTALIQAGNLEIGSINSGANPFPGYIDQVAIYSAKVTQATHRAAMHQGLTGSETSLISAYANGSTTDLSANANNLTAQNGATTVASSPFGNRGTSSTLDYGLVMKVNGTDVTVQVPEGCTIPTSGGVSAVAYSTQANPFGFVTDKGRWQIRWLSQSGANKTGGTNSTYYDVVKFGCQLSTGGWTLAGSHNAVMAQATAGNYTGSGFALTTSTDGTAFASLAGLGDRSKNETSVGGTNGTLSATEYLNYLTLIVDIYFSSQTSFNLLSLDRHATASPVLTVPSCTLTATPSGL